MKKLVMTLVLVAAVAGVSSGTQQSIAMDDVICF